MAIEVSGIRQAQSALNNATKDIEVESELMLSVMLEAISANTKPYVPVDTSFLINSAYRSTDVVASGVIGEIGYGAEYAVYVHEGAQKNWQKPGASNLFLLKGVEDFIANDLSSIIARFTSE